LRRAPAWSDDLLEDERRRHKDKLDRLGRSSSLEALSERAYSVPPWTDVLDVEGLVEVLVRLLIGEHDLGWPDGGQPRDADRFVTVELANATAELPLGHTNVLRHTWKRSHAGNVTSAKVSTGSVYQASNRTIVVLWSYERVTFLRPLVHGHPTPPEPYRPARG
jgi:hypothetical protein